MANCSTIYVCSLISTSDRDFWVVDLHSATLSKISQVTVAISIIMKKRCASSFGVAGLCSLVKASCCQLFSFQILPRVRLWENHTWWWSTSLVYCNKIYFTKMFCVCLSSADLSTGTKLTLTVLSRPSYHLPSLMKRHIKCLKSINCSVLVINHTNVL